MRFLPKAALFALAGVAASLVPVTRADAAVTPGHEISVGVENTAAGHITGMRVQRFDRNINASNFSCSYDTSKPNIIQGLWLYFTDDLANYLEFGTIHKNTACKFWFWVEGAPAHVGGQLFHELRSTYGLVGEAEHTFSIIRNGTATGWEFYVDNTLVAAPPIFVNNVGRQAVAGLETQNVHPSITVARHGNYSLKYNQGGTWIPWSGFDSYFPWSPYESPNPGTNMCGLYVNATHWRAGEHTTC